MAEIIYLKDILFIKPENKSKSARKLTLPAKSKSTKSRKPLKSSIIEKKNNNKRS